VAWEGEAVTTAPEGSMIWHREVRMRARSFFAWTRTLERAVSSYSGGAGRGGWRGAAGAAAAADLAAFAALFWNLPVSLGTFRVDGPVDLGRLGHLRRNKELNLLLGSFGSLCSSVTSQSASNNG
jgi:hypothetical protein